MDYHSQLVELLKFKNKSDLARGEILEKIYESGEYKKVLGEDGGSFNTYLGLPEVKINKSTSDRLRAIYRKFIKELGMSYEDLDGLDTNSLHRISTIVTKKNLKEWLSNIKNLSRSDIDRMIKYPGVDVMKCKHVWKELPVKHKCDKCGEITLHTK